MERMLKIACCGCGAPLEVGEERQLFTCRFCGVAQKIARDGDVYFSRVSDNTTRIAAELAIPRLEKETETLRQSMDQLRSSYGRKVEAAARPYDDRLRAHNEELKRLEDEGRDALGRLEHTRQCLELEAKADVPDRHKGFGCAAATAVFALCTVGCFVANTLGGGGPHYDTPLAKFLADASIWLPVLALIAGNQIPRVLNDRERQRRMNGIQKEGLR